MRTVACTECNSMQIIYWQLNTLTVIICIMLENSWSNKLTQEPKMATILNLPNPTIIYQTTSNQLMAHSQTQTTALPIRKDILAMGSLNDNQVLLLSRYQLSCFDLLNNNELFSLQFENALKLFVEDNLIFVVCGCDLFCYDHNGQEQYVNHCAALIECIATTSVKGVRQVVVGLNDLNLIRYRGVNIALDYGKVAGTPSSLCWIGEGVLVGTQEGTVAYYQGKKSKWKAKSHHSVFKVLVYYTQNNELAIIGRKDGLVEIKDWRGKGQTLHKIKLHEQIIGLIVYDFRQQNNTQLICLSKTGKIIGLNVHQQAKKATQNQVAQEVKLQNQNFEMLEKQKLQLEFEINELQEKLKLAESQQEQADNEQILRADFDFQTLLSHEKDGLILTIQCTNGFVSGLSFEEPVLPESFDRQSQVKYLFKAQNMIYGQINCFVLVHSSYAAKVYEGKGFKITLPKFWKFGQVGELEHKIQGGIRFKCVERVARYIKWITQCFFVNWTAEQKNKYQSVHTLKLKYYNAYDKVALELNFLTKQSIIQIHCECLKTLGNVFQDLVEYIGVQELDSELWFPKEKTRLLNTLNIIQKLSQAKASISSEMAEAIDNIKFMLVKGESARLVSSMREFRKTYTDIMGYNRNLMTEIEKKNQNTKQLSQSLKDLGQLINQTANVRFGKAKEMTISGCREAIKKKEFPKIVAIMERGASAL